MGEDYPYPARARKTKTGTPKPPNAHRTHYSTPTGTRDARKKEKKYLTGPLN